MIIRCAKCKDLLAYDKKLSNQVVDKCHNGCDAGVQVSPEQNEVIGSCWYKSDARQLQRARKEAEAATPEAATPEVYCESCGAMMAIEWSRDQEGDCILAHRCDCEKIVTCWYKTSIDGEWETGLFHQWSQNYEEFESGPGNFPAAIIVDATGRAHVVHAGWVSFNPERPDD